MPHILLSFPLLALRNPRWRRSARPHQHWPFRTLSQRPRPAESL